MRKHIAAVFVAAIALVLVVLAGCGQVEEVPSEGMRSGKSAVGGVRVSCIDVGKGDCLLVQADGSSALIDTGYDDTADEVIAYLQAQGVERLDCVVITHYDKDHVGGLRAMGESFELGRVLIPGYVGADKQYRTVANAVKDLKLPAETVTKQQVVPLGNAELTVFPTTLAYVPDANGDEGNDNDLSLVVSLGAGTDSYLFAGDLEEEGIEAYLAAGHGQFDVLKVPHHGEKAGNTDELLEDVRPKIALVTDAADDPADKKTLKLLKKAGVEAYCTSASGTIVVESDGAGTYNVTV